MSDYSRGCLSSEAAMEKHRARGYDGRVLFIRIGLSDVCIISDNHSRKDDRSQEVRGVHAVTSVNRDGEADHGAERMDWNRAIEAFTGCAVYEGLQNESIKAWGSSPVMMVDLCDDEINGRLEWPEVPQETISSWSGASSSTAHARNGRSGTAGLFKRHGAFDFLEMPPLQWQSPENTVRISTRHPRSEWTDARPAPPWRSPGHQLIMCSFSARVRPLMPGWFRGPLTSSEHRPQGRPCGYGPDAVLRYYRARRLFERGVSPEHTIHRHVFRGGRGLPQP